MKLCVTFSNHKPSCTPRLSSWLYLCGMICCMLYVVSTLPWIRASYRSKEDRVTHHKSRNGYYRVLRTYLSHRLDSRANKCETGQGHTPVLPTVYTFTVQYIHITHRFSSTGTFRKSGIHNLDIT
ncbi:hypothetical protein K504DRAFT_306289 [Pleomassaria siparia CBS 279.74]|uniref:Uncharacterized protein n=1 Tax=Pleomassaria siparia CBS 279.74 TaxID=1314801 RepID=A0A6G1K6A3_9PLEO|nr:hypothetical protein K504DRAFT_306289 [Pleomassaria siparia CBS 279.74]